MIGVWIWALGATVIALVLAAWGLVQRDSADDYRRQLYRAWDAHEADTREHVREIGAMAAAIKEARERMTEDE